MVSVVTVLLQLPEDGNNWRYPMKKWFVFYLLVIFLGVAMFFSFTRSEKTGEKIRRAGVAGAFYPADPAQLSSMIEGFLDQVRFTPADGRIIGLVAPHAGYIYSGPVAAYAYRQLTGLQVKRVVIIAPSHIIAFEGASIYNGEAYETPLGIVPVDMEFCRQLAEKSDLLELSATGHETVQGGRMEHALEVQLPFLQKVIGSFSLVPIIMGDQSYEVCRTLGNALADLINDQNTIIVASSDLSHYHPYNEAVMLDKKVITAISEWDYYNLCRNVNGRLWEACGGGPITATMIASEKLGADESEILRYANSGDVPAGDKSRVVGYTAAIFYKSNPGHSHSEAKFELSSEEQEYLLKIARQSVEEVVQSGDVPDLTDGGFPKLAVDRGAFVTLTEHGNLRGCIGFTSPIEPLFKTVRDAAVSAAMKDPRFPSVKTDELPALEYEISVLSPFRRVTSIDQIKIGKHGLLIRRQRREGLLLPQVATDYGWDRTTFLENTCRKAGLPLEAWKQPDADLFMFSAFVFGEEKH
jgi:AmmeMemoRadiSam system protein B/AmmeMemoRadiSam system protein A